MKATTINKFGKSEKNTKVKEGDCIFPFKYKWKEHNECYETEKGPICATSVNDKKTLQTYGYCTDLKKGTEKKAPKKVRKLRTFKIIETHQKKLKKKTQKLKSGTPKKAKTPTPKEVRLAKKIERKISKT